MSLEFKPTFMKVVGSKKARFPWLKWKCLNSLGNVHFLQVSYIVLVGVPIWALIQEKTLGQIFSGVPLTLRLGYFSALLLSVAHMVYQGSCPQIIRRFDSPNDLYRDLLQIKSLQAQYLPEETGFVFDIEHCRSNFTTLNISNPTARIACGFFYGTGLLLFIWLVVERSAIVLSLTH